MHGTSNGGIAEQPSEASMHCFCVSKHKKQNVMSKRNLTRQDKTTKKKKQDKTGQDSLVLMFVLSCYVSIIPDPLARRLMPQWLFYLYAAMASLTFASTLMPQWLP